jgi:hypothetical protein
MRNGYLSLASAIAMGACGHAPGAAAVPQPEMEHSAVASSGGVRMVAQLMRDVKAAERVTAVRAVVQNRTDEPVLIRYSDFKLWGSDGVPHRAIPPLNMAGAVAEPSSGGLHAQSRPIEPAFLQRGFRLAPHYRGRYRRIDAHDAAFDHDPWYHDDSHHYWGSSPPTREMVSSAIPEGVLEPGGYLAGYLYFQKLDRYARNVRLQAVLQSAFTGESIAMVELAFVAGDGEFGTRRGHGIPSSTSR